MPLSFLVILIVPSMFPLMFLVDIEKIFHGELILIVITSIMKLQFSHRERIVKIIMIFSCVPQRS